MRSRIQFFRRGDGVPLDEIDASTKRSWILNNFGECTFTIGRKNPKLTRQLVEFGGLVLVTSAYTEPWVGVIDTDRDWTSKGPQIKAYSAEILFSYRTNQGVDPETGLVKAAERIEGTAGNLFSQIVERLNKNEDTLIRKGKIYLDGDTRQETLNSHYLDHARSISNRSGNDFDVLRDFTQQNTLVLSANWYQRKGIKRDIPLEEGVNIQLKPNIMSEQGIILNSVLGIGYGSTDATRIGTIQQSALSISRFGLREGNITFSSVKENSTLASNTQVYVNDNAYPRVTARVTCVIQEQFKEYMAGDTAKLVLHTSGFLDNDTLGAKETVRVLGTEVNDDTGAMDILVDSFLGDA